MQILDKQTSITHTGKCQRDSGIRVIIMSSGSLTFNELRELVRECK